MVPLQFNPSNDKRQLGRATLRVKRDALWKETLDGDLQLLQAMKLLCAALIAITISLVAPARARADITDFRLSRIDHQAHIAVSYGLTLTGYLILERHTLTKPQPKRLQAVLIAALATLAVGGLKELVIDDPGDASDMVANVIGVGGAASVVFAFRF